jgi:hypothetical protein
MRSSDIEIEVGGRGRVLAELSRRPVDWLSVPTEAGDLSIFDSPATRRLIHDSYRLTAPRLEQRPSTEEPLSPMIPTLVPPPLTRPDFRGAVP